MIGIYRNFLQQKKHRAESSIQLDAFLIWCSLLICHFPEKAYKSPFRHVSGEMTLSCMSASLPKRDKATI